MRRRRTSTAAPRRRRVRNPDTARVDAAWVKGLRVWIKRTFVPKKSYASASDVVAHLRRLDRVELNRLYEYLFYATGLQPRGEGYDSILESLRTKIASELKVAEEALSRAEQYAQFVIDCVTPGTREYEYRDDVRYELTKEPGGIDAALLRHARTAEKEALEKVDEALSGRMLRAVSAFLTKYAGGDPYEPDEILLEHHVGAMKLIYSARPSHRSNHDDKSRDPRTLAAYVRHFRNAKALLERRGFGMVWYGATLVTCPTCGGENPLGANFGVGAHYFSSKDRVVVYQDPVDGIEDLIIHELGHRYFYKFMDRADRLRFDSYFGDVKAVSEYGSKNSAEDFAEVFSHYVTGRDMTRPQIERFKAFLAKKDRRRLNPERPARRTRRKTRR